MVKKHFITSDGNTAAVSIAYLMSEVAAIYPITPSSSMGEQADAWSSEGKKNIFGEVVKVQEMQSEGGAAGAIHGSLSAGALTTTFTASQGLLLMLPNMFKIAGEMLPTVFHVSARSLAYQSLSIFGDQSDVMTARGTGFAMLCSSSVQECQDMAAIAHLSTLEARVPFMHFFDGFRTSSEVQKIEALEPETLKSMIPLKAIYDFRKNALNPEHPVAKVGAQNPDVYFQGRERANQYYLKVPGIVKKYMELYGKKTGRKYNFFDYYGAKNADKVIIIMGSGGETCEEVVEYLNKKGENVGVVKVRLFRPFSGEDLAKAIPKTAKNIAVLDRTKEAGSIGEPLYLDVVASLKDRRVRILGGRYGLASKEFNSAMVKSVFDYIGKKDAKTGFTVGIDDDLTKTSLKIGADIDTEHKGVVRCKFWGYGSDGTVSANKNSIHIIGDYTDKFVQAYFVYDSKKSGGSTVSYLRFSDQPIKSQYLLTVVDFVALHKPSYIGRFDILEGIKENGTFLLNTPYSGAQAFESLTKEMQETIIRKKINFYAIDASKISREAGLGNRINTVMQAAFFAIANILPEKKSVQLIKQEIERQFKRKGEAIIKMNWLCVDNTLAALKKVEVPKKITKSAKPAALLPKGANAFAKEIIEPTMRMKGDNIPVSKMPLDGAVPTATTRLEKRGVSDFVPKWKKENCIQCGRCSFACPHAAIRTKQIEKSDLKNAPKQFDTIRSNTKNERELQFRVQVYPEDCMGCTLCVTACPVAKKALQMIPIEEARKYGENANQEFFESLKDNILDGAVEGTVKWSQLKTPLFEFSLACAGCGETPYIKLLTQLFGENMIIANATGCSSIYGGTFPTIPYCKTKDGKGPAWANSLFEDNAEYGLGMRLAVDANRNQLKTMVEKAAALDINDKLKIALQKSLQSWGKTGEEAKKANSAVLAALELGLIEARDKETKETLKKIDELKYYFLDKSVWIIGGDGWAYDIGYGGLDHVLAQGKKVKVLVLDTEVYSNTGGQASKSTPLGASAKFAVAGKRTGKKNLGLMMMTYGNVYVASICMGSDQQQAVKAFMEAENYDGPSIIIAYSPCIAHGFDMNTSQEEEKKAVDSAYWPLYRYNPKLAAEGKNPLQWDTPEAKSSFKDFLLGENRYKVIQLEHPDEAEKLYALAEQDAKRRFKDFKVLLDKGKESGEDSEEKKED